MAGTDPRHADPRADADGDGDCDVIISIRGLANSFGDQIIHDGLDLDVRRGEILGVVGGSGTGKSVLMRRTPTRAKSTCSARI